MDTAYFRYDGRGYLRLSTNDASQLNSLALRPVRSQAGLAWRVDDPIFADGFESGDFCAWSSSVGGGDPSCPSGPQVYTALPTYGSHGVLNAVERESGVQTVLYFAGRPVALLEGDVEATLTFLTPPTTSGRRSM